MACSAGFLTGRWAARYITAIEQALVDATKAAVARVVFGAPTMCLGGQMFYGTDAVDDLNRMPGGKT